MPKAFFHQNPQKIAISTTLMEKDGKKILNNEL